MGNKKNYIEINGKRYDAVTGAMIDGTASVQKSAPITPIKTAKPVVDGFVKRPRHTATVPASRAAIATPKQQLQHSKTLMRSAVKKPLTLHATAPVSKTQKHSPLKQVILPRTATIPENREKHAQQVKKSAMVQKFGAPQQPAPVAKQVAAMGVQPAPPQTAPQVSESLPVRSRAADLLDRALESAQSHNEPFHDLKKPLHKRIAKKIGVSGKAVAISTTVVAGLLIGGLYAYQNVPNLAMKVAATRAGFGAAMPSYAPSGFDFKGPVQYSAGQVVVSFKSNTDNRTYKLTQQTSSWTSDTLLNNFVAVGDKEYQTYQDRGRTIYIYDGSSATWVNGGVWYQIEGESNLSSDQLVRIAASL